MSRRRASRIARCWQCTPEDRRGQRYFIEIGWSDGLVSSIRDFRYVSYIAQEGAFQLQALQFMA